MSRTPMEANPTRSDVFGTNTIQDKSGRSSLNSPIYPAGFRGLPNTTSPTQGYPMAIPNGIMNQRPVLTGPSPLTNHSQPPGFQPPSPITANQTPRPGSASLPAHRNFSPVHQTGTATLGQNHSPVAYLAGPSLPAANTAATSRSIPHQPSGIPTSHTPSVNFLTSPQLPLAAHQVNKSALQPNATNTHHGIHGSNTPPHQPSPVGPPSGHVVGSTGKTLLPASQQPPQSGQGIMPSTQASIVPSTKRRVYPSQSHGSSYPSPLYPTAAQTNQPMSNREQVASGNLTAPNTNQLVNNQMGQAQLNPLANQMGKLTVQTESQPVNLLDKRNITPPSNVETPSLSPELSKKNASQSVLCCTLNNIPENNSLLQKCKLPFGILVHPFKDLSNLPVINSSSIVRCRSCRTYINPFVVFTEMRKWKCNMCYRINEVPEEFCYDAQTKSYGDPSRRPEVKSATYEFIAPSEYMLRSPQPSSYVFAFDVSFNAIETGYLKKACDLIKDNLDKMPGDSRAMIGFLTFNKNVSFYNLRNDQSQPQMFIVSDIDDIFLPSPEDLLVNLRENKEMIIQFLETLPQTFATTADTQCATGAALQAALKLLSATGGRITVFQTTLPSAGPGTLENRDEPGVKSAPKDALKLNPATDFYKKLALDCAADQVAIDVFLLSAQYGDLSSLMCASKYSGGCASYFPNFHISKNPAIVEKFQNDLTRYLTRKIGFEAVMRVRCTKGLSIHTFHGNFFVRSTDLLSLPNVNPDSAFGMQISIEDSLTDTNYACFQSALLYTSSRGERRIRVHNMSLPITKKMSDVYAGANVNAIALMLSKMAVDRSLTASLGDAREALLNAVVDFLGVYKSVVSAHSGQLLVPNSLRMLPLYVLSLLKQTAFRLGCTESLDVRCFAMQQFKVMPFNVALLSIYPALYSIHNMTDEGAISTKNGSVPQPPRLLLSGEQLSRKGIFLMDAGQEFVIWIGRETSDADIQNLFGVPNFNSIPEDMWSLPDLDNSLSQKVRVFIDHLQSERTNHCNLHVLRDNSKMRMKFVNKLMNDRTESMMSYHEFMIHIQGQIH